MNKLILSDVNADNTSQELLAELRSIKHSPRFMTHATLAKAMTREECEASPTKQRTKREHFTLTTTNEKVHLALGKLSILARNQLCGLLLENIGDDNQLVFNFKEEDGTVRQRNLFVTLIGKLSDGYHFHIAPGH